MTVSRKMAIFELQAGQTRGMTLSDIARHLEVNKSIALRILSSLEQANYLFRTLSSRRYLLTYRVSPSASTCWWPTASWSRCSRACASLRTPVASWCCLPPSRTRARSESWRPEVIADAGCRSTR